MEKILTQMTVDFDTIAHTIKRRIKNDLNFSKSVDSMPSWITASLPSSTLHHWSARYFLQQIDTSVEWYLKLFHCVKGEIHGGSSTLAHTADQNGFLISQPCTLTPAPKTYLHHSVSQTEQYYQPREVRHVLWLLYQKQFTITRRFAEINV